MRDDFEFTCSFPWRAIARPRRTAETRPYQHKIIGYSPQLDAPIGAEWDVCDKCRQSIWIDLRDVRAWQKAKIFHESDLDVICAGCAI